jgi:hypothetical protein
VASLIEVHFPHVVDASGHGHAGSLLGAGPGGRGPAGAPSPVRSRIGQSTEAAASAAMPRVQRDGIEQSGAAEVIGCSFTDADTGNEGFARGAFSKGQREVQNGFVA